jgi:uncharacterized membrane protein YccC
MGKIAAGLRDPLLWTDVLQLVKTAAAAVLAWVLATQVFSLAQSFLAPWAALLVIHATVYRTLARGLQQAAAAIAGVLLAFAAGATVGLGWASLALVLVAGLAVGTLPPLREESTSAATTALVVLVAGYSDDGSMLLARLADTFIGIGVGLAVNLAVWPPLRDRSAARRIDVLDDQLGRLLGEMADELRELDGDDGADGDRWVERTRALDHGIDASWRSVEAARESGRLNPRRRAATRIRDTRELADVLLDVEQAVAETRSMARTMSRAGAVAGWDPGFRAAWTDVLARAAEAVGEADPDAVRRVRERLAAVETSGRPAQHALLVNLRSILEAMAPVAAAQPVRVRARREVEAPAAR